MARRSRRYFVLSEAKEPFYIAQNNYRPSHNKMDLNLTAIREAIIKTPTFQRTRMYSLSALEFFGCGGRYSEENWELVATRRCDPPIERAFYVLAWYNAKVGPPVS